MQTSGPSDDYVFAVAPLSGAEIEDDAAEVHRRFSPHLLREPGAFDVINLFDQLKDHYKLEPIVADTLSDGVEGIAYPDGRVIISQETYSDACEGMGRPRFTIAHEAYHGIRHRGQIRKVLVHSGRTALYRRHSVPAYRNPEWQADRFAAALLMPADMVRQVGRRTEPSRVIETIVRTFQVFRRAAEIRAQVILKIPPRLNDL